MFALTEAATIAEYMKLHHYMMTDDHAVALQALLSSFVCLCPAELAETH
jgi:hypothetical protein